MLDVFVMLPDPESDNGNSDFVYVSTTPSTIDMGDIIAALQVLFPNMIGCSIEPTKTEIEDATD